MRNRVGLILFITGLLALMIFGSGLDSPGDGWKIALVGCVISFLIAAVGYLTMDVNEILGEAGFTKTKDSKAVADRKARNREQVWQTWSATVDWRH